jgi:hypothetical protein
MIEISWKWAKKGTLKIQKSQIAILVLNQPPISAVFPIVRFAGDPKTALTGDPLYEVCDSKSEKSAPMYCFKGTLLRFSAFTWIVGLADQPGSINIDKSCGELAMHSIQIWANTRL